MGVAEIIGIVVGLFAILTAVLGGLAWLIRAQQAMQKEFKPNGGSSTRDSLNRIESDIRNVQDKLDDHINWHMDRR
jgi:hypothetical protein